MNYSDVKSAVEAHVKNASGYPVDSKAYNILSMLFRCGDVDLRWFGMEPLKEVRMDLYLKGFTIGMKWDRLVLEENAVIDYYRVKMGLEYTPPAEGKTYFQRLVDEENKSSK